MPSVLFISLKFFLSRLAMFGITAATSCFTAGPSRGLGDIFTPREIDDYFRYMKYVEKLCLKAISITKLTMISFSCIDLVTY